MNSVAIIFVLHSLLLRTAFTSDDYCSKDQYLSSSGDCINCTLCGPTEFVVKECDSNTDTLCQPITNFGINGASLKPSKNKKTPSSAENAKSKDESDTVLTGFESVSSYDFMLHPRGKNNGSAKERNSKDKVKNDWTIDKDSPVELLNSNSSGNKIFGKHIKKDLSTLDVDKSDKKILLNVNDTKFSDYTELKKKEKEWIRLLISPLKKDHIKVGIEKKEEQKVKILVDTGNEKSRENNSTVKSEVNSALADSLSKNETYLPEFLDEDYDDLDDKNKQFDDFKNGDDDEDYEDKDKDDDDDDDEDDEDDDEDDDDEDDHNDDDGKDEDDEDEDIGADIEDEDKKDTDESLSLFDENKKENFEPFGTISYQDSLSSEDPDDDENYMDDPLPKNTKWSATNEVNVEPYIIPNYFERLYVAFLLSAFFLFFVVLIVYICNQARIKQHFEADVEDLSVRINLMQHAGYEAEEASNMKNYLTQLKGGKINSQKLSKPIVRV